MSHVADRFARTVNVAGKMVTAGAGSVVAAVVAGKQHWQKRRMEMLAATSRFGCAWTRRRVSAEAAPVWPSRCTHVCPSLDPELRSSTITTAILVGNERTT